MLGKLAVRNVRRQIGNYLIYFITVSLTVALMFAFNSVVYSPQLQQAADAMDELKTGLTAITVFISLIVAFVLGYATSFMLRLRKREFGTYLTLGMTRRNILALFVLETLILGAAALAAGIVLGLFVYQGLMLLLVRLLEMEFTIAAYSLQGLLLTVVLVAAMFALASLTSALYLRRATVYQLLHGDRVVEKNVRHPGLWLAVTLVSLAAAVGSCVLAVVPDEAVAGLPLALEGTAYDLADTPFDAEALRSDLSYLYTTPNGQYQYLRCDYDIREYGRLSLNANAAVFILGALYTAVVFVCMVMAILALKTLSGLAEDRRRYTVLMRLGADRRTRCRALLRQTFSFFLLPFALPLLLSIPTAIVCADIMNLSGYADLARQVPICTLAVAAVMILLYLLYFTATYLLARRAVVDAE